MADRHKEYIVIEDSDHGFPLTTFAIPKHYREDLDRVLVPHGMILDRVEKVAQNIVEDINGPLVVLCVLKGGHQVFADVVDYIKKINTNASRSLPLTLEFIRCKSYHNDKSTGEVVIQGMDLSTLKGQHVLIVEDIVDTGRSLKRLVEVLKEQEPASLRTFALLIKRTPESNGFKPDYAGFEIPNEFVVGYCLDYNEYFRDLDHICVISENGKRKYAM
eukprot:comp12593_c0_seq1/m.7614 comp12593_c0_seq1/g.7614  ORF comp12593_c0_seq1/g.7614 comp12593_c0_seq1/m.7614 type:complete len:218 (-) comp12593_c0_seq1:472-1125(-)